MYKKVVLSFFVVFLILVLFLFLPEYASALVYDDFNDNVLNLDKWIPTDFSTTPLITDANIIEANGVLSIDIPSFPTRINIGGAASTVSFFGDFDYRAEWGISQISPDNIVGDKGGVFFEVRNRLIENMPFDRLSISRNWSFSELGQKDWYSSEVTLINRGNVVATGFREAIPSDTAGYFGIQRRASSVQTYYAAINYPDFSDWNLLLEYEGAFIKPVSLIIAANVGRNAHVEFDNVEIKGNVIPEPSSFVFLFTPRFTLLELSCSKYL